MDPVELKGRVLPKNTRLVVYKGPPGSDVGDLHVLQVGGLRVDQRTRTLQHVVAFLASCWMPTDEEREAIASGAVIWLEVQGGEHPPVSLRVGAQLAAPKEELDEAPAKDAR